MPTSNFQNKIALVWDGGLFPFTATTLAKSFGKVYYYSPYQSDAFPLSRKALWGMGLPNVERTNDFFTHVEESDILVFPDVGMGDLQSYLKRQGKAVWGAGDAEIIELDRVFLKKWQMQNDLRIPRTWIIHGVNALREHLSNPENNNQYVKVSTWRGDLESKHHQNNWLSQTWLDFLTHQLGPNKERITFVVESAIEDAVESGWDGISIDGAYPSFGLTGWENKDTSYIGMVTPYSDCPPVLREVNDKLAPFFKSLGARTLFSTEVRVIADGSGYLIDIAMRNGSPPSECMQNIFSNWGDIIGYGAQGVMVVPEPAAKFAAQIVLRSDWAENDFLPIRFPSEYRDFIHLHGHTRVDNMDYVVSIGMDIIGSATGIGSTPEEATENALEVAGSIEAHNLVYDKHGFEPLWERIDTGKKRGIPWG
jgi:hypothetical protein